MFVTLDDVFFFFFGRGGGVLKNVSAIRVFGVPVRQEFRWPVVVKARLAFDVQRGYDRVSSGLLDEEA